jgi:hypothetical protein
LVHFSVLVNSTLPGLVSSSCGLRQRNPLSPLLFVIVREVLSRMISTLANEDLLPSLSRMVSTLVNGDLLPGFS